MEERSVRAAVPSAFYRQKDAESIRGLAIGLALSAVLWAPLCLLVPRFLS